MKSAGSFYKGLLRYLGLRRKLKAIIICQSLSIMNIFFPTNNLTNLFILIILSIRSVNMKKDIFSQLKTIEDGMNNLLGAMSSLTHSKYTFHDNYDEVWTPNCDVYISNSKLNIVIELAGVEKDSIELIFNDSYLLLKGNRDFGVPCSDVCFYHMEIETGSFERAIYFPDVQINKENPIVKFENGILNIQFELWEEKESIITVE